MTPWFLTGFEHGLISLSGQATDIPGLFNTTAGTPSIVTQSGGDQVRTGTYALKISAAAASEYVGLIPAAGVRQFVIRFYLRFETLPVEVVQVMLAIAFTNARIRYDNVTGRLTISAGTPQTQFGPVLSPGVWYCVDISLDTSTGTYSHTGRVDNDVSTEGTSTATLTANDITAIRLGSDAAGTFTAYYDDWVVSKTIGDFPIGPGRVLAILPGSDGTHSFTANDFSTGDAGTLRDSSYTDFYLMVDDAPPWVTARSTTDNITQRVIRNTGYVEIKPATSAPAGETASAVRALMAYSSTSATANTAACIIRNSTPTATTIWGTHTGIGGASDALTDHSETTNFFKGTIVTAPGAGWTKTEIEALRWRVGGAGDITPVPTWQFLMLEVDYPEAAMDYVPRHPAHDHANPAVF